MILTNSASIQSSILGICPQICATDMLLLVTLPQYLCEHQKQKLADVEYQKLKTTELIENNPLLGLNRRSLVRNIHRLCKILLLDYFPQNEARKGTFLAFTNKAKSIFKLLELSNKVEFEREDNKNVRLIKQGETGTICLSLPENEPQTGTNCLSYIKVYSYNWDKLSQFKPKKLLLDESNFDFFSSIPYSLDYILSISILSTSKTSCLVERKGGLGEKQKIALSQKSKTRFCLKTELENATEAHSWPEDLLDALLDYAEMRKKQKKPIATLGTFRLMKSKINSALKNYGLEATKEMIFASTANCWQGLFTEYALEATETALESTILQKWYEYMPDAISSREKRNFGLLVAKVKEQVQLQAKNRAKKLGLPYEQISPKDFAERFGNFLAKLKKTKYAKSSISNILFNYRDLVLEMRKIK